MARSLREIVTLQFGHYSNFVGAHWWNIQESAFVYKPSDSSGPREIVNDILFREGQNILGDVTYTPRLVSFDLKGSLNTLKQEGTLYDLPEDQDNVGWPEDVTLHKYDAGPKNAFLQDLEQQEDRILHGCSSRRKNPDDLESEQEAASSEDSDQQDSGPKQYSLDDNVTVWSDFLKLHLHPKTLHIINSYQHDTDLEPFDIFSYGRQVFKEHSSHSEIEDRLHFYFEDCDNLQGMHVLVDTHDGFGGLASAVLEELQDDYQNKGILIFGVAPPSFPESTVIQDCYRLINSTLAYDSLTSLGSLFVPLSMATKLWKVPGPPVIFPHLRYQPSLSYHTSAVLGASLDTMTLPYRCETSQMLLSHLTDALTPLGRKVACLQTSLPFPMRSDGTLVDALLELGDRLPWQPLTPMCSAHTPPTSQSTVIRGIPPGRLIGPPTPHIPRLLGNCSTVEEVLHLYFKDLFPGSLSAICPVTQPLKTSAPYPHIFSPVITSDGFLTDKHRLTETSVESVPMMTSLQSSPCVAEHLNQLYTEVSKLNVKKFHKLIENGVEEDDLKESMNKIKGLVQSYENKDM